MRRADPTTDDGEPVSDLGSTISRTELLPRTGELIAFILEDFPVHRSFLDAAVSTLEDGEAQSLERYLDYCVGTGLTVRYLADCYMTIVGDTLREQIYFRQNGRYRHSTFAEVASSVYFDDDYMSSYMYGLAITDYLWPNHRAIFRFFRDTLPLDKQGSYLEIGPGHGYFLMTAATSSAYGAFTGVDISETSVALTRSIIDHSGVSAAKEVTVQCVDFLDADLDADSWDAVVMGEVLEHVERPDVFLKQIAHLAKDDAYIFISTCINAPAVDHIYLFSDPTDLQDLFREAGLAIERAELRPYEGKTLQESLDERLAVNVAYVLRKSDT
jgi:2-polyprenyl-3-methyl-5-hydroxy-6-metoxy-1,4-benzoquinol methylase